MMTFRVHYSSRGDVNSRFNRDESPHQWLTNSPDIEGEFDDLASAETFAYAQLGRDCRDTVWITRDDGMVVKAMRNDGLDTMQDQLSKRLAFAVSVAVLALYGFLVAALFGSTGKVFLVTIASLGLYAFVAKTRIQNEIESAVLSFIIQTLSLLLLHLG